MSPRIPFPAADEQRVLTALASFTARDRCAIIFGLNTGFRACELTAITVRHVWDGTQVRPEITLARRNLKGGRGLHRRSVRTRTLPLNDAVRLVVKEYLEQRKCEQGSLEQAEALFRSRRTGRGLSRWRLCKIVHRAAIAAGLDPAGRWGCHTLRKTFCREIYLAVGKDINLTRQAMGHRNVSTTQAYLESDPAQVRSAILAIGCLQKNSIK